MNKQFVLSVTHPNGRQYYIALLGIQGEQALIASGSHRRIIKTTELKARWQGTATGVFASPEDFSGVITYGNRGKAVNWLVRKLHAALQRNHPQAYP